MRFFKFLVGTFGASAVTLAMQRNLDAPYWSYYVIALAIAATLFVTGAILTQRFIARATGPLDTTEVMPGVQAWELTAGTGIVPKWVSYVGLAGMFFGLAIPFELIAMLIR